MIGLHTDYSTAVVSIISSGIGGESYKSTMSDTRAVAVVVLSSGGSTLAQQCWAN